MSHVHAFFIHTYHFFLYLIDINYVGTFLFIPLSLSLSLSLFLSVSCSMALKWKSTLYRNPICSRTSSFSPSVDPTPSHVQFHDDKARKHFSENFSRYGIHLKCQVVLSDFSDIDLPTVIYSRGWESLCGIPITCTSVIIQKFYSNMHGFDYSMPHFITHVRGTRIVVTSDLIFEVLHVPRVEFTDYPSC